MNIRHGARASESGIDVDDRCAALFRLHHPLEADRMALGHIRTLNDNAVGVLQVLLKRGCTATAKRGAQTGHG